MRFSETTVLKIAQLLEKAGFFPMEDFTAVDSLIHRDKPIGFYSLKSCNIAGEALSHDGRNFYVELDCDFEIRLMGKSCDFADYKQFDEMCAEFYKSAAEDGEMLIRNMKMDNVYQSMPLKRLARNMIMQVRVMVAEELE